MVAFPPNCEHDRVPPTRADAKAAPNAAAKPPNYRLERAAMRGGGCVAGAGKQNAPDSADQALPGCCSTSPLDGIAHRGHHATTRHCYSNAAQSLRERHAHFLSTAGVRGRNSWSRWLRHPFARDSRASLLYSPFRPAESSAGCYIRVSDVNSIYRAFASAELPRRGIPRQEVLEDKPWGMREFAIVDPDGNLIRIGRTIEHHG